MGGLAIRDEGISGRFSYTDLEDRVRADPLRPLRKIANAAPVSHGSQALTAPVG